MMPVTYINSRGKRVDPWGNVVAPAEPEKPEPPAFDPAEVEDGQLDRLNKAQLLAVAEHREVDVDSDATNAEIAEAILTASDTDE